MAKKTPNKAYDYNQCQNDCLVQIKKYNSLRAAGDEWEVHEFQDIRDELSEALVRFGPCYADLRADAEKAEYLRKVELEKRKLYWRNHYDGERGTATLVESQAIIDIEDFYEDEVEANRLYYRARMIIERIDQTLNSIASRLKILDKYDG